VFAEQQPKSQTTSTNPDISRQPLNAGQRRLHTRGLLAAATTFGWQNHDHSQRWYYPAIDPLTHAAAQRSKAYDSASRYKYLWHGANGTRAAKPAGLHYYAPQGSQRLRTAIQHTQGTLYIANGEPAVLTLLAAGRDNVLSWCRLVIHLPPWLMRFSFRVNRYLAFLCQPTQTLSPLPQPLTLKAG
jgi:hypothetical protein